MRVSLSQMPRRFRFVLAFVWVGSSIMYILLRKPMAGPNGIIAHKPIYRATKDDKGKTKQKKMETTG